MPDYFAYCVASSPLLAPSGLTSFAAVLQAATESLHTASGLWQQAEALAAQRGARMRAPEAAPGGGGGGDGDSEGSEPSSSGSSDGSHGDGPSR